jgi:gluconate 2-dehydrogenase subunit 3-like protein
MERRELFKIIAAEAVAIEAAGAQHQHPATAAAKPYARKFFSSQQERAFDSLCDIIIPADSQSPGAHEAKVWQYIDLITHYGTPAQKQELTRGLALVDRAARKQFQKPFANLDRADQEEIVAGMAAKEPDREDELGRFFIHVKRLVIEGYHYSEVGMKRFMGYRGNTAISEFPGCAHPEHQS